jgi:hypothetical protein
MDRLSLFLKPAPCEYHEENHTYTSKADGKLWPGVTSIGNNLAKPQLIPWAAKMAVQHLADKQEAIKSSSPEEYALLLSEAQDAHSRKSRSAADAGTLAHKWCEEYIKAELVGDGMVALHAYPEDPVTRSCTQAFCAWQAAHHVIWLASELVVGSAVHEFGGTLDALAIVDGIPSLIDFKTSNQISKDYFIQTAAYHLALEEMGLKMWQRIILRIPKDGSDFEALIVPTPLDLDTQAFLALRQVQRWQKLRRELGPPRSRFGRKGASTKGRTQAEESSVETFINSYQTWTNRSIRRLAATLTACGSRREKC